MKQTFVFLGITACFLFTACENAEISEVAPSKEEPSSESSVVRPQYRAVDTNVIKNRINYLEFLRMENGSTPILESEIQLLKDSIGDKTPSPIIEKPASIGNDGKIATH